MPQYRLPAACLLVLALPLAASETFADCCAGHRAGYLAYGGGLRHAGPAQPFQGIANPRYASTRTIGGPMTSGQILSAPVVTNRFAKRPFINSAALRQTAQLRSENMTAMDEPLASDTEMLTAEPVESLVDRLGDADEDTWQPAYPGQVAPQRQREEHRREEHRMDERRTEPQRPETRRLEQQQLKSAPQESGSPRRVSAESHQASPNTNRSANAGPASPLRQSARFTSAAKFTSLSMLQSGSLLP